MKRSSHSLRGLGLAAGAALWGAAFLIPYKQAVGFAPPAVVAFALLTSAAVLNSLLSLAQPQARRRGLQNGGAVTWWTAAALAVLATLGNVCNAQALTTLEPATASVLLRSEVVFVGLLAALFLGERLSLAFGVGAGLALLGLWVMRGSARIGGADWGLVFGLGAAVCFAAMHVLTRKVAQRVSLVRVNGLRLWLCALFMVGLPGVAQGALAAPVELWLYVALAAFCGPVLGRLLMMFSARHIAAAETALVLLLGPVLTLALAYLFLGTVPTAQRLLGGAVMLVGIAVPVGAKVYRWSQRGA